MLHAFARNKSRAYTRYLRVRDPSEPRVSSEDEITSLVFGPLDFLSASDNWILWSSVFQSHASNDMSGPIPQNYFSGFSPSECTFEFWPRKDNIEPDLVIRFSNESGETRSLLVELKWDAGVSGADQLEKQWLRFHEDEHASSLHVFIAKSMGDLPTNRRPWSCLNTDGSAASASRLRGIRWHEFRHEIVKLADSPHASAPLKRWCDLVSGFLKRLGIRPFVGFGATVRLAAATPEVDKDDELFWLPRAQSTITQHVED